MTDRQLAAYLDMLTERLNGIRNRLIVNLDNTKLEHHPETHLVSLPFHDDKLRPHPRADQPVCLDELADLIFELRVTAKTLREKPEDKEFPGITNQIRSWRVE